MPFFRKKAEPEAAPPPTKREIAAAVGADIPEEPTKAELPSHPVAGEAGQFAPMFVRVDKYREIISELNEIKTFAETTKRIFDVLSDAESVREDALKALRATLQRMERAVAAVDSELLRPIGFEAFPHGEVEAKHIESNLTALHDQLSNLRRTLEGLSA